MSQRFAERSIVVTGASSGIGRALAIALGAEGARLVLGGRSQSALDEVVGELRAQGCEALAVRGDLREDTTVQALVATALEAFGALDVMVNNAGVAYPGPVLEGNSAEWRELLATNVLALCVGCREAARAMAGRGGVLVNVSSVAGRQPTPGDAVYCATKHAVHAFSAALRVELAPLGVQVLVVEPGQTLTSIARGIPPERLRALGERLGIDPSSIPDFAGRHVPQEFAQSLLRSHGYVFLDPRDVARAVLDALAAEPVPESVTIVPSG